MNPPSRGASALRDAAATRAQDLPTMKWRGTMSQGDAIAATGSLRCRLQATVAEWQSSCPFNEARILLKFQKNLSQ
jgi:hypothetical protein